MSGKKFEKVAKEIIKNQKLFGKAIKFKKIVRSWKN